MICPTCADAANRRAPADQHCGDPKCMCGHRTDKYRPAPEPEDHEPALTVKHPSTWVPACENGRHYAHPGETCDEYEAYCEAARAAWESTFATMLHDAEVEAAKQMTDLMLYGPTGRRAAPYGIHASDAPASLRGPNSPGPTTGLGMPTALYDRMREVAGQMLAAAPLPPMVRRLGDGEDPDDRPVITAAMLRDGNADTAPQCRAEFHHPAMQSARCDLPAGHPDLHREQSDSERVAFRWDDSVAMYPSDTAKD